MVYRFTIVSDEVDEFFREIKIDAEETFFEFHKTILKSCGYADNQMTSFFLCNDGWEKEQEVTLEDMGTSSDVDCYLMRDTALNELIEDERQRLLYVFDPLADRVFFIELSEISYGKDLSKPVCSRKAGAAPKQAIDFDEVLKTSGAIDLDENFFGDQEFDIDELDIEGFDMGEGGTTSLDSLDRDLY